MTGYTITIKRTGECKPVNPAHVAGLCVEMCGGGYTEAQTRAAMAAQAQIEDGRPFETERYVLAKGPAEH